MPTPAPNIRRLYALVPCAGSGVRAGAAIAKQYVEVAGRPLIAHTLAALVAVPRLSRILVVVSPEDRHYEGLTGLPVDSRLALARCGGTTRGATVAGGLAKLAGLGATANDWVLVHDAARCLVRTEWIEALVDACRNDGIGGRSRCRSATRSSGPKAIVPSRRCRANTSGRHRRRRCSGSASLPTRWREARRRPTKRRRSRRSV